MSPPILEATGLEYRYEDIRALCQVDLPVERGAKLGIVGANGSGKTTLLLHLNGTLRPRQGAIRLHGRSLGYNRQALAAWRRQVGLVLQNPDDQLFAATVAQDVSFGPSNLGLSEAEVREKVEEALTTLGMGELADRPTHQLSFGQKKRVVLAGALAMRPSILLLDEPTSGLDPCCEQQMRAALERLHRQGTTLLVATHDMDLAYEWADTLAVMHEGRILCRGDPEVLFQDGSLLCAAHLRMPRLLEIALGLRGVGLLPETERLPRTTAGLCALLERHGDVVHPCGLAQSACRLAGQISRPVR